MVAVWTGLLKSACMHGFGSAQCSVEPNANPMRSMRIGFALNSHWAIWFLNLFESRFSVDRPYNYSAVTKI